MVAPVLPVVLLPADVVARAILHPVEPRAFVARQPAAVPAAARLVARDPALLALEPVIFATGQLAAARTVMDAALLLPLAVVDLPCAVAGIAATNVAPSAAAAMNNVFMTMLLVELLTTVGLGPR